MAKARRGGGLWGEPVVQFLGLGGLVFLLWRAAAPPTPVAPALEASPATVAALQAEEARRTGARPDDAATARLVATWEEDEALFQEALRLGLHERDAVVRRRLIQQVEALADEVPAPTEADLAAWLADHPDDFRRPETLAVSHRFFGGDEAAAAAALARLQAGEDAPGQAFVHGLRFPEVTVEHLRRLLGQRFADAAAGAPVGAWLGPVRSSYGLHALRVEGRTAGRPATLAEVRADVEAAWREAAHAAARARLRARLAARHRAP
ncbi:MAG: peptidyl-prolyl cis-trans isomerase [Myxococcales bacterium]|nr:peptidyl-prolyl cis-trans isomerase [Myxococcales bacterium]